MADIRQGVRYEIDAEDRTGPATDSALANLLRQERAAKRAGEAAKREAAEARGFFAALTNALGGNFQALGEQVARAAAKLGGFRAGPKALAAVGLAVTGAISAARGLAEAFRAAAREARALEDMQVADAIDGVREEARGYADEMERAARAAAGQRSAFEDDLRLIGEMTAAQNELARQRELALARTQEERDEVGRRHGLNDGLNAALLDGERRRREAADARDEVARLERALAEAESAKARANKVGRTAAARLNGIQNRGFLGTLWGGVADRLGLADNAGDEARAAARADESAKAEAEAARRVADVRARLEAARHRLEVADREEEAAAVRLAAKEQEGLNEDFRRADEAAAAAAARAEGERVRADEALRLESARRVKERRLGDAAEVRAAERAAAEDLASARTRLAAAQAAVRQAWGWYRDKGAMAAQLAEEKADAEAARRFERDFARLSFRRDWRTAKDLSVDQEAVRRVGLAREEEAAAKRAAAETAANTARAAAALEAIERALQEGGE